jgi:hypothetical protein
MTQAELYTYARRLVNATSNDWTEADLVIDLNDGLADGWARIKTNRGVLEYDDTNYTDLPVSTLSVASSRASYKITEDENSNEITIVHKVSFLHNGAYLNIPRLTMGEGNQDALDETNTADVPSGYYDIGASIVFTPIPSTSTTAKVWYDRVPSYFATGGSVTPGIPSPYHKLVAEKAALSYAVSKGMNASQNIMKLIQIGEQRLDNYEQDRRDDEATLLDPVIVQAR